MQSRIHASNANLKWSAKTKKDAQHTPNQIKMVTWNCQRRTIRVRIFDQRWKKALSKIKLQMQTEHNVSVQIQRMNYLLSLWMSIAEEMRKKWQNEMRFLQNISLKRLWNTRLHRSFIWNCDIFTKHMHHGMAT